MRKKRPIKCALMLLMLMVGCGTVTLSDRGDDGGLPGDGGETGMPDASADAGTSTRFGECMLAIVRDDELYVVGTDTRLTTGLRSEVDWSPANDMLAFVAYQDGQVNLYMAPHDGGTGATALTRDSALELGPRWSPDGSLLALISLRSGSAEINIIDREGVIQASTSFGDSMVGTGAWWTQSQYLFPRYEGAANYELYTLDVVTGEVTNRTADFEPGAYSPAVSAFTGMVAFKSESGIYMLEPASGEISQVTTTGETPVWSPDGIKIAYVSGGDLYTVDVRTSGAPQRVASGGDIHKVGWSPAGIAFRRKDDGFIYFLDAEGAEVQVEQGNDFAWSSCST